MTSGERTEIVVQGNELVNGTFEKLRAIVPHIEREGADTLHLSSDDPGAVGAVIDLVRSAHGEVISVVPHKRTLEEVFVETVRKEDEV